jgi:hypothetical protein
MAADRGDHSEERKIAEGFRTDANVSKKCVPAAATAVTGAFCKSDTLLTQI